MSSRIYVDEIYPKTTGGAVSFPEKPTFRVGLSALQSIPNAVDTKVQLNDVVWNVGGHFDTSNNWFKPTVAGYYQIIWHVTIQSSTPDFVLARIYKNGSVYGDFGTGESNAANMWQRPVGVSLMYLNGTSDYVEFYVHHNVGSATNASNVKTNTEASGFLVS